MPLIIQNPFDCFIIPICECPLLFGDTLSRSYSPNFWEYEKPFSFPLLKENLKAFRKWNKKKRHHLKRLSIVCLPRDLLEIIAEYILIPEELIRVFQFTNYYACKTESCPGYFDIWINSSWYVNEIYCWRDFVIAICVMKREKKKILYFHSKWKRIIYRKAKNVKVKRYFRQNVTFTIQCDNSEVCQNFGIKKIFTKEKSELFFKCVAKILYSSFEKKSYNLD